MEKNKNFSSFLLSLVYFLSPFPKTGCSAFRSVCLFLSVSMFDQFNVWCSCLLCIFLRFKALSEDNNVDNLLTLTVWPGMTLLRRWCFTNTSYYFFAMMVLYVKLFISSFQWQVWVTDIALLLLLSLLFASYSMKKTEIQKKTERQLPKKHKHRHLIIPPLYSGVWAI